MTIFPEGAIKDDEKKTGQLKRVLDFVIVWQYPLGCVQNYTMF